MTEEEITRGWLDALDRLEKALEDPNHSARGQEGLMKRWGALLVETSQRAFTEQRLGEHEWPERYPGMDQPFINVAGALTDFEQGRSSPKPSRFQNRPALVDEGMRGGLWGSLTFNVPDPHTAEVGTNKPYGKLHQEGGETVIRISEGAYQRGRAWLFAKSGEPRKGREGFVAKLWPSLFQRRLHQSVIRRPFLGVPPETAENLIRATVEYFEGEQLGGGDVVRLET